MNRTTVPRLARRNYRKCQPNFVPSLHTLPTSVYTLHCTHVLCVSLCVQCAAGVCCAVGAWRLTARLSDHCSLSRLSTHALQPNSFIHSFIQFNTFLNSLHCITRYPPLILLSAPLVATCLCHSLLSLARIGQPQRTHGTRGDSLSTHNSTDTLTTQAKNRKRQEREDAKWQRRGKEE